MTTRRATQYQVISNQPDDNPMHKMSHQLDQMIEMMQGTINKMNALDQARPLGNHRIVNNKHKQDQSYMKSTHDNRVHRNIKFNVPNFDGSLDLAQF